jgi:hypothetical protein
MAVFCEALLFSLNETSASANSSAILSMVFLPGFPKCELFFIRDELTIAERLLMPA